MLTQASGDGHPAVQSRRNIRLTGNIPRIVRVSAPRDHRAVALEGETVIPASGNGRHVGQSGRNIDLAVIVVTPRDHRAVALEGETVITASGNGYHVG